MRTHQFFNYFIKKSLTAFTLLASVLLNPAHAADANPSRILMLGDSLTAGYTNNPEWTEPFEFGFRSGLYKRLSDAKLNFTFVGDSKEPFNNRFGDPTLNGQVTPKLDLRALNQDGHRGYGNNNIGMTTRNLAYVLGEDKPNIILLLIGINDRKENSAQLLDELIGKIYAFDRSIKLIVAQIPPMSTYNQNVDQYNQYIKNTLITKYTAQGFNIATVDMYSLFLTNPTDRKSIDPTRFANGLNHPTNKLYDEMAGLWFRELKQLLIEQNKP